MLKKFANINFDIDHDLDGVVTKENPNDKTSPVVDWEYYVRIIDKLKAGKEKPYFEFKFSGVRLRREIPSEIVNVLIKELYELARKYTSQKVNNSYESVVSEIKNIIKKNIPVRLLGHSENDNNPAKIFYGTVEVLDPINAFSLKGRDSELKFGKQYIQGFFPDKYVVVLIDPEDSEEVNKFYDEVRSKKSKILNMNSDEFFLFLRENKFMANIYDKDPKKIKEKEDKRRELIRKIDESRKLEIAETQDIDTNQDTDKNEMIDNRSTLDMKRNKFEGPTLSHFAFLKRKNFGF